ncbi:hypothetical protein CWI38_0067p0030 [Hamiltosporidium tvaerminnensis]|uniref:Uncharacterized protein n=1 Tax=Hamiltosporidium tvaerminnensis TaxID=1176355 RepID=A0A4Q9M402_9MICR|nr:hypothetical protein CWI38_0067p0030 [Hamiltosporidium tvaerminnensis]
MTSQDLKKRRARPRDEAGAEGIFNTATKILDRACRGKKDTRIKTDVRIRCNRPDLLVLDKRQNKTTNAINDEAYIQSTSELNTKESRESQLDNEEDDVLKRKKRKYFTPDLSGITYWEPKINANEDSKLEDELEDVKIRKRIILKV